MRSATITNARQSSALVERYSRHVKRAGTGACLEQQKDALSTLDLYAAQPSDNRPQVRILPDGVHTDLRTGRAAHAQITHRAGRPMNGAITSQQILTSEKSSWSHHLFVLVGGSYCCYWFAGQARNVTVVPDNDIWKLCSTGYIQADRSEGNAQVPQCNNPRYPFINATKASVQSVQALYDPTSVIRTCT